MGSNIELISPRPVGIKAYLIVQTNLQRKELAATTELLGVAEERKVAVALIQEPYVGSIRRMWDYRVARIFQA